MRTANPALGEKTFLDIPRTIDSRNVMTIEGTVNKTLILVALVVASAAVTWNMASNGVSLAGPLAIGGAISGFIVAMVTIFKNQWSPVTAPLYAVVEGLFLGAISAVLNIQYPGIVPQAVALTVGTLFCLLAAYRSGAIKATENFKLGVVAATGAVCVVYIISIVLRLFGSSFPMIHEAGPIGIGFSLVVVVIAALNLVLDFDFIEEGARQGAPRHMEWYAGFGLLVTLVWLYIEILRLLAKLNSRD
jgi:uncharacterized YccA/Bax inhibitor family protein